jgi:erythromycin esterase
MRIVAFSLLPVLVVAACATEEAPAPGAGEDDWLRSSVIPIAAVEPANEHADLMPLEPLIGTSRVVAMGEIVHRAHELLAFRNRLFQFLVEEMGFRVIAMETGFPESLVLREFVEGGDVDLDAVASEVICWGFDKFHENRELLHWIRDYNLDPANDETVRFYGFELPGGTGGVYFSHAARFIESLVAYVAQASPEVAESIRARMQPLLPFFDDLAYSSLDQQERDRLSATLNDLVAAIEQHRIELVAVSSQDEWAWSLQTARTLRQLDDWYRLTPSGWRPTESQPWLPNIDEALTARDFGMWENVQWILAREASERVFLFSHNAHIQNALAVSPEGPSTVLGQHLKASLGDGVFTIGSVHQTMEDQDAFGEYWAGPSALADRLSGLGIPALLLSVRDQPWPPDEHEWWTSGQRVDYGFTTVSLPPAGTFDAWLYVERLTPYVPWER